MTTPTTSTPDLDPAIIALENDPSACLKLLAYLEACQEVCIDKITPPSAIVSELYADCGALDQVRAQMRAIKAILKRQGL